MSFLQLLRDILEGDAHLDHEDGEMIDEVGDFENRLFAAAALAGNDYFRALLADLFQDLVNAFLEEVGEVFLPSMSR